MISALSRLMTSPEMIKVAGAAGAAERNAAIKSLSSSSPFRAWAKKAGVATTPKERHDFIYSAIRSTAINKASEDTQ